MKKQTLRRIRILFAFLAVIAMTLGTTLTAYAYPGEISADNVNVRKSATVSSDSLGTLRQGTTIDIEGEETDAAGQVWYRITYNGQTGYVRGDLVEAEDGGNVDPATQENPDDTETPTATGGRRIGTVSTNTPANVREGPSRNYGLTPFSPIPTDAVVDVIGDETDNNGEIWYHIIYNDQEGYVIGSLLDVSEAPAEPAEPTEPAEPVEPIVTVDPGADNNTGMMGQQYTVAYDMDDTGETVPYLVDNNNGSQRWRVQVLLDSYDDSVRLENVEKSNTVLKIVCVILGIITLIAVILLILLGMRFRRYTEDDYEDDNGYGGSSYDRGDYDDGDEEEDDDVYDDRRGRSGGFFSRFKRGGSQEDFDDEDDEDYDDEDDDYEEEPRAIRRVYQPERDAEVRGRSRSDVVTPSRASRRPRNFMEDEEEDDYEYSFLDDDR